MPASLRFDTLSNVHDHVSGVHFGLHKTFDKIKQIIYIGGKGCIRMLSIGVSRVLIMSVL